MADIELVIKIPEYYYENNIKNDLPIYLTENNVIKILPKHHGRLIDADALRADYSFCWDGEELLSVNSLIVAPTIIEADKEVNAYE